MTSTPEPPQEETGAEVAEETVAPAETVLADDAALAAGAPVEIVDLEEETADAGEPVTVVPDPRLIEARDLALAALHEITPAATVGPPAGYAVEEGGPVSLRFENRLPGYPGWYWTVTLAVVGDDEPTVLEVELLPGDGALVAPEWVPWADRLAEYRAQAARQAEEAAAAALALADDDEEADDEEDLADQRELDDDYDDGLDFDFEIDGDELDEDLPEDVSDEEE